MIRTLVATWILAFAPATASAEDWSVYGGVSYGQSAGQIHKNTSSYTATPHASGHVQPRTPDAWATSSGSSSIGGPEFFTGGRYWIFLADLSAGLSFPEPHESRWELMVGLQPPIGWPIRYESPYLKVIPSFVVGGGAGGMALNGVVGYLGYIARRGPYGSAALRVDVRAWKVLLRVAGQYRAMFTRRQVYMDLSDGPSVDYDFANAGFSWDLGFKVSLGVEFP
jgi:hypothetical protein